MGINTNKTNNKSKNYYLRNREKLLLYYHIRYLANRKDILEQKKEYNKRPEVKHRSSEYHKKYYQEHKAELDQKHKEYSRNRRNSQ